MSYCVLQQAVLSAVLESAGLCVLCYSVLGRYQAPVSLLLLAALLLVPAFSSIFAVRDFRRQNRVRPRAVGFVVVSRRLVGFSCSSWRFVGLRGKGPCG